MQFENFDIFYIFTRKTKFPCLFNPMVYVYVMYRQIHSYCWRHIFYIILPFSPLITYILQNLLLSMFEFE